MTTINKIAERTELRRPDPESRENSNSKEEKKKPTATYVMTANGAAMQVFR